MERRVHDLDAKPFRHGDCVIWIAARQRCHKLIFAAAAKNVIAA